MASTASTELEAFVTKCYQRVKMHTDTYCAQGVLSDRAGLCRTVQTSLVNDLGLGSCSQNLHSAMAGVYTTQAADIVTSSSVKAAQPQRSGPCMFMAWCRLSTVAPR
jgi:hypothetical protein